ncbi:MAG: hypothetical protein N2662_07585 [Bacteroidales bacterium]|nr:hypothetical protein [Bacteroidales bacterium]
MSERCEYFEKCPIYSGILVDMAVTAANYRRLYCEAGESGWNTCKRYQVRKRVGRVPADLLPNSFKTVEEIIASME